MCELKVSAVVTCCHFREQGTKMGKDTVCLTLPNPRRQNFEGFRLPGLPSLPSLSCYPCQKIP